MKSLYSVLLNKVGAGRRPVDLLKKLNPKLYQELVKSYGKQTYRNSKGTGITTQLLYDHFFPNAKEQATCVNCGISTPFGSFKTGYATCCSRQCVYESGINTERSQQTLMRKYGVTAPAKLPQVVSKMKSTNRKRLGVPWPQQAKKVRKKSQQTMLQRYGAEFNSHVPETFKKILASSYRTKTVKFKGVDIQLQGYEPQALNLLTTVIPQLNPWMISTLTSVPYVKDGTGHVYYPDFTIGNLVVEVKSIYTAGLSKRDAGNTEKRKALIRKLKASRRRGYDFLLLVMLEDKLYRCAFNDLHLTKDLIQFKEQIHFSGIVGSFC